MKQQKGCFLSSSLIRVENEFRVHRNNLKTQLQGINNSCCYLIRVQRLLGETGKSYRLELHSDHVLYRKKILQISTDARSQLE